MPELYIITGSNGAGKSSVGKDYLPQHIQQHYAIFDGDKLFMQRQKDLWNEGIRANKEAKKLAYEYVTDTFDQLVEEALAANETFVYEGHFTNDATWDIPKRFKGNGYIINLIFFGLTTPDISELRVVERTKEGGHYVSRTTVEDNFYGNLEKLNKYFSLIDHLLILDTSGIEHRLLVEISTGTVTFALPRTYLPTWFKEHLPDILALIN